ncbi:hypothetical protein D9M72_566270 [compost metagenome]
MRRATSQYHGTATSSITAMPASACRRRHSARSRVTQVYATSASPGSTSPASPLVSSAIPIAVQHASIQLRRAGGVVRGCCASNMLASAQARTPESVMSSVLK